MDLPDLEILKYHWYLCQEQDPEPGGYGAIIDDNDMQVPFFAKNLDEWKELWPAFMLFDALWEEDYEIYEPDDLEEIKKILNKFENVTWNDNDFYKFELNMPSLSPISIERCGPSEEFSQDEVDKMRNNMG